MIELLEPRIAPAALTNGGKLLTFTDIDGDLVHVSFSTAVTEDKITFQGGGFLPGNITAAQKLDRIDLTGKVGASITAMASPQKINNILVGDSHVNIRVIDAIATDLNLVKVDGDLMQIQAGDGIFTNAPGVKTFITLSIGKNGGTTNSSISGVGTMLVRTDIDASARVEIQGGAKSITIGGSLIGNTIGSGGALAVYSGGVGKLKIAGSVYGNSGTIAGNILINGDVGSLSVGGSILGGDGSTPSFAQVKINGNVGTLTVGGDVVGGNAIHSGEIEIQGSARSVSIGGALAAGRFSFNGLLSVGGDLGKLRVGENIVGGNSTGGAFVSNNGSILVSGSLGSASIGGDFIAGRIVDNGGSFSNCGVIGVRGTVGTIKIGGNINGDPGHRAYITAGGFGAPEGAPALKKLSVKGTIADATILLGYDQNLTERNLKAGVGSVTIGGSLEASYIIAGSNKGPNNVPGDEDDITVNGIATIGSVRIGGAFLGRASDPTSYYVYAPHILLFQVGKAKYNDAQLRFGPELSGVGSAIALSSPK